MRTGKPRGPARRRRATTVVSAGGVVFRKGHDQIEVVLVGRSAEGLWVLPKGMSEPGEHLLQTARREVREETGLEVEVVCPVRELEYSFVSHGVRIRKLVWHYLLRPVGGDTALHDPEYDLVCWFDLGDALERLTHLNERNVLARAAELIRALDSDALPGASAD